MGRALERGGVDGHDSNPHTSLRHATFGIRGGTDMQESSNLGPRLTVLGALAPAALVGCPSCEGHRARVDYINAFMSSSVISLSPPRSSKSSSLGCAAPEKGSPSLTNCTPRSVEPAPVEALS